MVFGNWSKDVDLIGGLSTRLVIATGQKATDDL